MRYVKSNSARLDHKTLVNVDQERDENSNQMESTTGGFAWGPKSLLESAVGRI